MRFHLDRSPPLVKPNPDVCARCGLRIDHRSYTHKGRYMHHHCISAQQQDDTAQAMKSGSWNAA